MAASAHGSAAKIAFCCGVVPARRSGARGGLYKLDESHATRWLGFFLFINVSSGSFRWGEDSHESDTPRGRKRAPEGGFPQGNFLLTAFFRLRGFLFLRVRVTDKQTGRSDVQIHIGSSGLAFCCCLFGFCAMSWVTAGAPRPCTRAKGP